MVAGGDVAAADAFLGEEVEVTNHVFGRGSGYQSTDAVNWSALTSADLDIAIDDVVATADAVTVRATLTGIDRGSLLDLASMDQPFEIACTWFCRIDDGRIAEVWSLPDGFGLLQQLGVVPGVPPTDPSRSSEQ